MKRRLKPILEKTAVVTGVGGMLIGTAFVIRTTKRVFDDLILQTKPVVELMQEDASKLTQADSNILDLSSRFDTKGYLQSLKKERLDLEQDKLYTIDLLALKNTTKENINAEINSAISEIDRKRFPNCTVLLHLREDEEKDSSGKRLKLVLKNGTVPGENPMDKMTYDGDEKEVEIIGGGYGISYWVGFGKSAQSKKFSNPSTNISKAKEIDIFDKKEPMPGIMFEEIVVPSMPAKAPNIKKDSISPI